ncbi:MAG: hypothetical protein GOV02_00975 [Candidatus Aenigmarchaeota archaeon]|nr:hypothetical protein [Candidatus Aenigmarchaeota archaeon]
MVVLRTALLVIILVLALTIAIVSIMSSVGTDFEEFIALAGADFEAPGGPPLGLGNQYTYSFLKDYGYDGLILATDDGLSESEMEFYTSYDGPRVRDCYHCKAEKIPTGVDSYIFDNNCKYCDDVEDVDYETTSSSMFSHCVGCQLTVNDEIWSIEEQRVRGIQSPAIRCLSCVESEEEISFCKKLKNCIYLYESDPEYYSQYGCVIDEIPRAQGEQFDLEWVLDAMSECEEESLKWDVGTDFEREVCYFEPFDARPMNYYYDSQLAIMEVSEPEKFYREESKCIKTDADSDASFTKTVDCEERYDSKEDDYYEGGSTHYFYNSMAVFFNRTSDIWETYEEDRVLEDYFIEEENGFFYNNYRLFASAYVPIHKDDDYLLTVYKFVLSDSNKNEWTDSEPHVNIHTENLDLHLVDNIDDVDELDFEEDTPYFAYKTLSNSDDWWQEDDPKSESDFTGVTLGLNLNNFEYYWKKEKNLPGYPGEKTAKKSENWKAGDYRADAFGATLFKNDYTHTQIDYDMKYSTCNIISDIDQEFLFYPESAIEMKSGIYTQPDEEERNYWRYKNYLNSDIRLFYTNNTGTVKVNSIDSIDRGSIKITLGGLDTSQKNCKYNIQICSQDTFAETFDDDILPIVDLFRFFNMFDYIYSPEILEDINPDVVTVVKFNPFVYELSENKSAKNIMKAVVTGFRDWRTTTFPVESSLILDPYLSSSENSGLLPGDWFAGNANSLPDKLHDNCTINVDNLYYPYESTNSIYYDCGVDEICEGELIMTVNFVHDNVDHKDPWLKPLRTIVTFCGD